MALRIGLFIAAALLLGAHFLREGNLVALALSLCAPLLFLHRKRWTLVLLQLLAYGAAGLWIGVALRLIEARQQAGRAWLAAAVILGSVALLSVLAGALLNSGSIRERYRR
ncbi:MAG: hypothetical protein HYY28_04585 [Betaproteobacteria bacterium]|nr:hypothetical protein [Betaproteobacteria bacterium]MBI2959568.1 hypothetical protein [Betaproteobacteria bacterium]